MRAVSRWGCFLGCINKMVVPKAVLVFVATFLLIRSQSIDDPCDVPSGKSTCVCDTGDGLIDLTSMSYNDGDPL